MGNEKIYIHEFIEIRGQNRAKYMHHMTANWVPVAIRERNMQCYGVWGIVGSTGAWPQTVNIWELDGWHGLAANFEHEFSHATLQDPSLAAWWAQAAEFRRGGFDRILVPDEATRSIDELIADEVRGVAYAHELVTMPAGASSDYLAALRDVGQPAVEAFGLELVGAFAVAMVDDTECIVIWAIPDWQTWAEFEAAEHDDRLAAWRARQRTMFAAKRRILLVEAPTSPMRLGRQPDESDRRPLDEIQDPADAAMSRARVNGLEIAYTRVGEGRPLVLLHGGMDDHRSWRRQLDGLADEFTVIAWDAPGCGESSEPAITWRIHDFADCLAEWLHAIGVERPHLLGLSWGSTVALELVRQHPDVPASLILASPYAGWAGSLPPDEVAERLEQVLAAADLSADAIIREGLPGLFSASTPPEVVDEVTMIAAANNGRAHPAGYRAIAHSIAEADLRESLGAITTPTLVIHGELDRRSPNPVAAAIHERIPSSRLVVVHDAGHLCNIEMPDEFNRHVREFIHSIDP